MRRTTFSVDVEKDLHGEGYKGITFGLKKFEIICDKNKIMPVLFVTGDCVLKYPSIFKRLSKKGWEISFHGLTHRRFDDLSLEKKEDEIKKGLELWKKKLGFAPRGFRAPQHSIDEETLDLLEKYGFEYDSSYHPLNLVQLMFFPKKVGLWFKLFFSRLNEYKIIAKLKEKPTSSLLVPFVSLTMRIFPKWMLRFYLWKIKLFYKEPMFYAHSWDFIEMKESRIDRMFPSEKFINKLDYLMSIK